MLAHPATDTRIRPAHAFRAVRQLLDDPEDTRQVFVVLRAMRGRSSGRSFRRFAASPTGAVILREQRCLLRTLENHAALGALPPGTLGRCYLAFMQEQHLSAAALVKSSQQCSGEALPAPLVLFRERQRDMHDLTHVLTGYGREGLGELCLLAFMYAHTRNPGMALIALMGMLRLLRRRRGAVIEAWRHGRRARWLPEQDWEALLALPLGTLRQQLGIADPVKYQAARS